MVDNHNRNAQFKVAYAHDVSGGYALGGSSGTTATKNRAISSKKIRKQKNKSKASRDQANQPTAVPAQVRQMY